MGWTFTAVTMAWVFFRADDLPSAMDYLSRMPHLTSVNLPGTKSIGLVGLMIVLDWVNRNNERLTLQPLPVWARAPLSWMMFWLILRHLPAEPNFIYFQF